MPTYVLRPTSTIEEPLTGTIVPAGSTGRARINDNSDVTWVDRAVDQLYWRLGYTGPSVPATQFIARVSGSARYRGANSSTFLSNYPYRGFPFDFPPPILPAIFLGAASFTTVEIGRRIADWPKTSITSLISELQDTWTPSAPNLDIADAWLTIYTVEVSTATPSNVTMTATNTPTIPVAVASTIDWESSLPTSSPLRKVTVEVRIEANSSTGAGTTPALLLKTVDLTPGATGTINLSIAMPGTLPNGTYKAYARARRYSEASTPTNETEMYSAWSAAATLTMNFPPMSTPTLTATADNTLNRTTLSTFVATQSPYTTATIVIERSSDAGTTWSVVRDVDNVAIAFNTTTTFYDREAQLGVPLQYRAQAFGYALNDVVASAFSPVASLTLAASGRWNLRAPERPNIDVLDINVIGEPSEGLSEDVGVFRPLDRRYPVVVAGSLTGWDGNITVETTTAADWDAVKAIIEAQRVLLLQSPFGWQKYIRLVGDVKTAIQGTPTAPRRRATLTYVETAAP